MTSGFSKKMIVVMTPLLIATLGGCVSEREKGAPVVMAPASGPVCVPRQVTSSTTVSPLASALSNDALLSGKAAAQPFQRLSAWSAPWTLRRVPTSS